ncbi:type IV secretory system conjugative DNA transfer family protein, partial [Campylobacter jejuni]|nr:type IV secretory system conjugative DNA transfer family protein [Campylobacter jejuni]
PIYQSAISFMAGYWLRSLMIYQSNSQLETQPPLGYGKEGAKPFDLTMLVKFSMHQESKKTQKLVSRIFRKYYF